MNEELKPLDYATPTGERSPWLLPLIVLGSVLIVVAGLVALVFA